MMTADMLAKGAVELVSSAAAFQVTLPVTFSAVPCAVVTEKVVERRCPLLTPIADVSSYVLHLK